MNNFRIVPLSKEYVQKIRETRKDDFGHEVIEQTATGLGPCRVSLKPFEREWINAYYLPIARLK